jgi:hypothetical protein
MDKFLQQAMREYNAKLPAWKHVLRFDQLSVFEQALVEDRVTQLRRETGTSTCAHNECQAVA